MYNLRAVIRDLSILAGAGCLVTGAWWAWPPAGLLLLGGCLAGFGILWELDGQRRKAEHERNRRDGL